MTLRIIYVGKHGSGGNDDEGAILHALRVLGYTVEPLREGKGRFADQVLGPDPDLLLFHKWSDIDTIRRMRKRCKIAFWYFDRVNDPDPSIAGRSAERIAWMERVVPEVDYGFCTDGDWVKSVTGFQGGVGLGDGKLHWLPQGADERVVGFGRAESYPLPAGQMMPDGFAGIEQWPILFTGIRKGGQRRMSFVDEMTDHYPGRFRWIASGCHGRDLADAIAQSKIVVAPDAPLGPLYWSNRVYNTLGFGGFLLHPYTQGLDRQQVETYGYEAGRELVFYHSHQELHDLIGHYLASPEERWSIQSMGLARTLNQHLYRHRLERLVAIVENRANLPCGSWPDMPPSGRN